MKNYYEILEVSQNASSEVIEKAYKALAKKYHPDTNPDNKVEAEEKFKEIGEAYETLSDPIKKEQYDYELTAYIDSLNNSNQNSNINNEDYENLASHTQDLENELEYLKRNQNNSNIKSNNDVNNNYTDNQYNSNIDNQTVDEIASTLNDRINEAYSKAYHDAYIKRLKDYGYKIRYKKSFKTRVKNFFSSILAIVLILLLLFILWQIPSIKNYFINLYNNNYILQLIGNMFINN